MQTAVGMTELHVSHVTHDKVLRLFLMQGRRVKAQQQDGDDSASVNCTCSPLAIIGSRSMSRESCLRMAF